MGSWCCGRLQIQKRPHQYSTRLISLHYMFDEKLAFWFFSYEIYAFLPKREDLSFKSPCVAGVMISLGEINYSSPRDGPTVWEIGVPDRTANGFFVPDPNPKHVNKLYLNSSQKQVLYPCYKALQWTLETTTNHFLGWWNHIHASVSLQFLRWNPKRPWWIF